jgi:hypothetical protein
LTTDAQVFSSTISIQFVFMFCYSLLSSAHKRELGVDIEKENAYASILLIVQLENLS